MLIVYSKYNCSQCVMVKNLLKMKKIEFSEKKLGVDFQEDEMYNIIESAKGDRSFPFVFEDDVYLGSLTDIKVLVSQGKL